jgi:pimeloyl-ACP methyl ester carboxylesterase
MSGPNGAQITPGATRFLDRPGGRVAYDVSGEGPLVVAAPGMGELRSTYRFLVPVLVASGYRVATMDLRGHGESDVTFQTYDSPAAGSDILALIEALGEGPAVVIGNSMAAGSAVWAAAEAPGLVAGLVLTGPFVRNAPVGRLAALGFRLALRRPWGARAWSAWYARLYPGRRPADLGAHRERIRANLSEPGRWDAFVRTTRTSHAPAEARLGDVTAPALVVMGQRDPDFQDPTAEAAFIGARLGARVLMLPEAGHYPHAEYPELVAPEIVRFLDEEIGRHRTEWSRRRVPGDEEGSSPIPDSSAPTARATARSHGAATSEGH